MRILDRNFMRKTSTDNRTGFRGARVPQIGLNLKEAAQRMKIGGK